eukprot:1189059-Prorocentrum_minimum.AAC.1
MRSYLVPTIRRPVTDQFEGLPEYEPSEYEATEHEPGEYGPTGYRLDEHRPTVRPTMVKRTRLGRFTYRQHCPIANHFAGRGRLLPAARIRRANEGVSSGRSATRRPPLSSKL